MKVPSTGYVSGFGPGVQPEGRKGPRDGDRHDHDSDEDHAADGGDRAEFLGIPEDELTPRVRGAIDRLLERMATIQDELTQTRQRVGALEKLADSDTLLPVFNRRAFMRELTRLIALTRRHGLSLSVMYIDVNGLKKINDSHGHMRGDAALGIIARTLRAAIRESDILGRMGGDEFALLLPHETGSGAASIGETLASRVAGTTLRYEDRVVPLSISYGVHEVTPEDDAQSAIAAADSVMYRHKSRAAPADDETAADDADGQPGGIRQ